jgi:hypothetical protein
MPDELFHHANDSLKYITPYPMGNASARLIARDMTLFSETFLSWLEVKEPILDGSLQSAHCRLLRQFHQSLTPWVADRAEGDEEGPVLDPYIWMMELSGIIRSVTLNPKTSDEVPHLHRNVRQNGKAVGSRTVAPIPSMVDAAPLAACDCASWYKPLVFSPRWVVSFNDASKSVNGHVVTQGLSYKTCLMSPYLLPSYYQTWVRL